MATFTKLKSGSGRVQIRRKGKYVNETFLRRKDAEEWALNTERRIDRKEPATTRSRDTKLFGDLISLHREDLKEVGKKIGRSKDASLTFPVMLSLIASSLSSLAKNARLRARDR